MEKQAPLVSDADAPRTPVLAEVLATLRAHEADIRALGVSSLSLFGSVARGDASSGSDVDLFCDYDDLGFSLLDLLKAQNRLSELLNTQVDLTTRDSLRWDLRAKIEASALAVF